MGFEHITFYHTLPELDQRLRAAHEERAASFYATWTAIGSLLSAVAARVAERLGRTRQAYRARRTSRALSALSDRQLRDIGLYRSQIDSVAEAAAAAPPESGVTAEELRRVGILPSAGDAPATVRLPRVDDRPRRPDRREDRRRAVTAEARRARAAG